jgi:hypothetical protein
MASPIDFSGKWLVTKPGRTGNTLSYLMTFNADGTFVYTAIAPAPAEAGEGKWVKAASYNDPELEGLWKAKGEAEVEFIAQQPKKIYVLYSAEEGGAKLVAQAANGGSGEVATRTPVELWTAPVVAAAEEADDGFANPWD